MFTITKEFSFSASHQLTHLPADHQCARLHGHNYKVELVLEADTLNADGFVEDYGRLSDVKDYIDRTLDHRHLNDLLPRATAEGLACFLFCRFRKTHPALVAVRVSETDKTWATYRGPTRRDEALARAARDAADKAALAPPDEGLRQYWATHPPVHPVRAEADTARSYWARETATKQGTGRPAAPAALHPSDDTTRPPQWDRPLPTHPSLLTTTPVRDALKARYDHQAVYAYSAAKAPEGTQRPERVRRATDTMTLDEFALSLAEGPEERVR